MLVYYLTWKIMPAFSGVQMHRLMGICLTCRNLFHGSGHSLCVKDEQYITCAFWLSWINCKLNCWELEHPICLFIITQYTGTTLVLQCSSYALLGIYLQKVNTKHLNLGSNEYMEMSPEYACEQYITITDNMFRETLWFVYLLKH